MNKMIRTIAVAWLVVLAIPVYAGTVDTIARQLAAHNANGLSNSNVPYNGGVALTNPLGSNLGTAAGFSTGTMNLTSGTNPCLAQINAMFNPRGWFFNFASCDTIPSGETVSQHGAGLFSLIDQSGNPSAAGSQAAALIAQVDAWMSNAPVISFNSVADDGHILATCSACTVSGTTLTVAGTVTGTFAVGQYLWDGTNPQRVTSGTTITAQIDATHFTLSNDLGTVPATVMRGLACCTSGIGLSSEADTLVLNTDTLAVGVKSLGYFWQGASSNNIRIAFEAVAESNSPKPWQIGFRCTNGACPIAFDLGSTITGAPNATGTPSQQIRAGYTDQTTGTTQHYVLQLADSTLTSTLPAGALTGTDWVFKSDYGGMVNVRLDNGACIAGKNAAGNAELAIACTNSSNFVLFSGSGNSEFPNQTAFGGGAPSQVVTILGNQTVSSRGLGGDMFSIHGNTINDTENTGTVATAAVNVIQAATLTATNPVTYSDNSTLRIAGAPTCSINVTCTNNSALEVATGLSNLAGGLTTTTATLTGALTYGGTTLAAGVTGTGNMVLSASPLFTGNVKASSALMLGSSTVLTLVAGEMGWVKITASGSAPGAAGAKEEWVCGTAAGSMKKIAYAGTSSTPVTITDNVGSGVTGC